MRMRLLLLLVCLPFSSCYTGLVAAGFYQTREAKAADALNMRYMRTGEACTGYNQPPCLSGP